MLGLRGRRLGLLFGLGDHSRILGLDHRQRRPQPGLPATRRGDLAGLLGAGQPQRTVARSLRVRILCGERHQLAALPLDPVRPAVTVQRRVRGDLRAIQRNHREIRQARRRAQPHPLHEQAASARS
ncbi:MAG TPA: hypothetical protein VKO16_02915 [Polyangia bacterium]|nr:hypothetical protein [Polyangia bacterium]